eukprot:g4772.t1
MEKLHENITSTKVELSSRVDEVEVSRQPQQHGPSSQSIGIVIPKNVKPGHKIKIKMEDGRMTGFIVPNGVKPGQTIAVTVAAQKKKKRQEAFANLQSPFEEPRRTLGVESNIEDAHDQKIKAWISIQPILNEKAKWIKPKHMKNTDLLGTIQSYARNHSKKLLGNGLRRFVAVSIFLVAINVETAQTAFHGSDSSNLHVYSNSKLCRAHSYIDKCSKTIRCEEVFRNWKDGNIITNMTSKIDEWIKKETISLLTSSISVNAASISIISTIGLLLWRDIRLVKYWGKYEGFSRRTFRQHWKFNDFQKARYNDYTITQRKYRRSQKNGEKENELFGWFCICFPIRINYKDATMHHRSVFKTTVSLLTLSIFLLYDLYFNLHRNKRDGLFLDISVLYVISIYLFRKWSTGDFTVIQMVHTILLLPGYQFLLSLVAIYDSDPHLDVFEQLFPRLECRIESKVRALHLAIEIFVVYITCCLLFLSVRKSIRKGELSILAKCTPPEYIVKYLIEWSDFTKSETGIDKKQLEVQGILPGLKWNSVSKLIIPTIKKRSKGLQQDKLISSILDRFTENESRAFAYTKFDDGGNNIVDVAKTVSDSIVFNKTYYLSGFCFNRISKKCKERLESIADLPLDQKEKLLLSIRTMMLILYFCMYSVVFYTSKEYSEEALKAKNVFVFFENYLGINGYEKFRNLLPVFVLYIETLSRLFESFVLYVMTKIRKYDTLREDENVAYNILHSVHYFILIIVTSILFGLHIYTYFNDDDFHLWLTKNIGPFVGMGFVALGVAIDSIQNQNLLNNNVLPVESNIEKKEITHGNEKNKEVDIISIHLPAFGCIATGGLLLAHATHRYYSVQKALQKGQFKLGTSSIFGIVFVTSILTVCSLGIIFSDFDTLDIVRSGNRTVIKPRENATKR